MLCRNPEMICIESYTMVIVARSIYIYIYIKITVSHNDIHRAKAGNTVAKRPRRASRTSSHVRNYHRGM